MCVCVCVSGCVFACNRKRDQGRDRKERGSGGEGWKKGGKAETERVLLFIHVGNRAGGPNEAVILPL